MDGKHLFLIFTILNNVLFIAFPVWAFIRLRVAGIVLATLFVWGLELLVSPTIAAFYPGGLWPFVWFIWLIGGWVISFYIVAVISTFTWFALRAIYWFRFRKFPEEDIAVIPEERLSWGKRSRQWYLQLYSLERIGLALTIIYLCLLVTIAAPHFPK